MMSQPKVSGRRFLVRPPTVCRTSDSRGAGRMDDHARDEASRFLSLGRSVPQIGILTAVCNCTEKNKL